jgi:hypothetical protein
MDAFPKMRPLKLNGQLTHLSPPLRKSARSAERKAKEKGA